MRKLAAVLAALLLAGCAGAQTLGNSSSVPPASSRQEPGRAARGSTVYLRCLYYEPEQAADAMANPEAYAVEGELAGGLVPHHLLAADMIAGFFQMAGRQADRFDTVLLVSPSHYPEQCGSDLVTGIAGWDTPYGRVEPDRELAELFLADRALGAVNDPAALEYDHGAAGLVPFVRRYLPDAKLTACLLSNRLSQERLSAFWETVEKQCRAGRVLLVVSADCSHYLTPEESAVRDAQTARAIEQKEIGKVLQFTDSNVDSPQSLSTLLYLAREQRLDLIRLGHSSSPEKLPHAISNPIFSQGITTYFVYAAIDPDGR